MRNVLAVSLAMVAAQAADALTMLGAFAGGVPVAQEANPVGRAAFLALGPVGILVPKLLTAAAIVGIIYVFTRCGQTRMALVLAAIGVVIGCVGVAGNTASWMLWLA